MAIRWTPWFDCSMNRRLEVFAASFEMFVALVLGPLTCIIMLYLVCAGHVITKSICLIYAAFIYYDRHTGDTGGRGAGYDWFRDWRVWKHYMNYFPIDLVKTVDLPADRNYLICLFPHGVLCQGAFGNFGSNYSKWRQLFPGIRSKCTTLSYHMHMPIMRELILNWGMCSASSNSLTTLLTQSNDPKDASNSDGFTSNAPVLTVGGAQEALSALPDKYRFVLKNRKGFAKIALRNGTTLVPAISFGENNVFEQIQYPHGTFVRKLQEAFKSVTKVAPVHFNGRGYLQYDFGFIPRRHPITTVIGAPMYVTKTANPTQVDIDKLHADFCEKLTELFETQKAKYVKNAENIHIEIIDG